MQTTLNLKKVTVPAEDRLQGLIEYRRILDEGYSELRANHRILHRHSAMHNKETVDIYYQRWLKRFSKELRNLDALIYRLAHPSAPCTLSYLQNN